MATAAQALDEFRRLIGIREDPPRTNNAPPVTTWYGMADAWCAMACSYVLSRVGIGLKTASVAEIMRKAQAGEGGWSWHGHPQPGDCVCFDWQDGGIRTDHVGMVEAIRPDGNLVVIEGNYQDCCQRVVRARDHHILGYARPPWGNGNHDHYPGPPPLRQGSRGEAVKKIQARLNALGNHGLAVDGDFGPMTDGAVRAFQRSRNLAVDGIVGPATWRALFG